MVARARATQAKASVPRVMRDGIGLPSSQTIYGWSKVQLCDAFARLFFVLFQITCLNAMRQHHAIGTIGSLSVALLHLAVRYACTTLLKAYKQRYPT